MAALGGARPDAGPPADAFRFARILLPLTLLLALPLRSQTANFYAQSLQSALTRQNSGLEFMLLDLRTHALLANTFANPAAPIPVGSLLKPFLAAAYLRSGQPTPRLLCRGHLDHCWLNAGHGQLGLEEAIARSCNAYFISLARTLAGASIPFLPAPPDALPETLIGLTSAWSIAPEVLVNAYASLLQSPSAPELEPVREGMRLSALQGTALRIGRHHGGVLAKTGTAPCADAHCAASGDGLVVAAVPAERPALLLLVRRRATTGAVAAELAGHLLSQLESLHAY